MPTTVSSTVSGATIDLAQRAAGLVAGEVAVVADGGGAVGDAPLGERADQARRGGDRGRARPERPVVSVTATAGQPSRRGEVPDRPLGGRRASARCAAPLVIWVAVCRVRNVARSASVPR